MSAFVYPLEQSHEDPSSVGGKATGLGRLLRADLPVPPGFVLTADALRAYLRASDLDDELAALLSAATETLESDLLARLRDGRWPEELRGEVATAYASLGEHAGEGPVAVRSSATAEDSADASFAGQHQTLLNVTGLDAVLDAVLVCWASLYCATARDYRRVRGVEDDAPAMAIVVQTLLSVVAAGVAFTLDPVGGDRDLVLIDAAWGLGEGVVAGIVSPDHYVVRKDDGTIIRREVTRKRVRITPAPGGGTRSEELSAELAQQPALSDAQIVELARLAAGIAEVRGTAQEVGGALGSGGVCALP